MIGRVAGIVVHKALDHVLIDVRGVGYIVHVSARTASGLPPPGGAVALFTELLVREDLLQLFGFPSLLEKEWHRLLTSVQGVGAKASMAILGTLGAEAVGRAIVLGDWNAVKAAPGVGPKLAQRVVMELKDKAGMVMAMGATLGVAADADPLIEPAPGAARTVAVGYGSALASAEALSALVNLGYGQGEAASAVAAVGNTEAADTAALIRAALKLLGTKG